MSNSSVCSLRRTLSRTYVPASPLMRAVAMFMASVVSAETASPSADRITSPGRSPAVCAGLFLNTRSTTSRPCLSEETSMPTPQYWPL